MIKKLQIDRIEGALAVMTDEEEEVTCNIPAEFFGADAKEGNIFEVVFEDGNPVDYRFLAEETESVRRRIKELMVKLRKKK